MTLDFLQLLDSEPIYIEGIGYIIPPTIRKIKKAGLKTYYSKLGVLQISLEDILKDDVFDVFPEFNKSEIKSFDAMCLDKKIMELLTDALSFFLKERIVFYKDYQTFICYDTDTNTPIGKINRDNFDELRSLILQLNFLETKSVEKLKFKNKRAEMIYKKSQQSIQKSKADNLSIGEMVAAICSNVDTYKYSDIWSLTVYQLYNLFFRLKLRKQIDITAQRWAAWGSEPFDFDLWCKNINN